MIHRSGSRNWIDLAGVLVAAALLCCGFCGPWPQLRDGKNTGVDLLKAAENCGWVCDLVSAEQLELSAGGGSVRLTAGSAAAVVNGVRLRLLEPVVRQPDGEWRIARRDMEDSLMPLLTEDAVPDSPVRKVVIDAGHGGADPGAQNSGLREKDVNLELAKRIARILEAEDLEVVMTRSTDVFHPLAQRADRVRTDNADLFISIHQNSAKNPDAAGIECFASARNRYAGASLRLAQEVQSALLEEFHAAGTPYDRGVKRADFRVIRSADCPAVLLECGFISNAGDRQRMTMDDYLDEFAQAAAEGILNYCRIRTPAPEEDAK